jgi:hypothetical protein
MSELTMPSAADSTAAAGSFRDFQWQPQPAAGAWVSAVVARLERGLPWAHDYAARLHAGCGTRLGDLIDTVFLAPDDPDVAAAVAAGWEPEGERDGFVVYDQPRGLFPTLAVSPRVQGITLELKVERVADFLAANGLTRAIEGRPLSPYRRSLVAMEGSVGLSVAERHASRGYASAGGPAAEELLAVSETLRTRPRRFPEAEEGFAELERRLDAAIDQIGRDAACDVFFAAEREYWMRRNRAARAQKARQDALGIGWANHDHHTYRCSRVHFASVVRLWEKLGLFCRERFYAGRAAGWGAQVMEHSTTRIVTFNDVDLSPEELMGDFSHDGLPPRDSLGTIGLWCGLHGESILQAGMHHLECVFDFEAQRAQLERESGVKTMKPFTDFPYLRQAFTEGERWAVDNQRVDRLVSLGLITPAEADRFRAEGAIGSHLEHLERNDGFKGFNQDGVSEIIAATDPRKQARGDARG